MKPLVNYHKGRQRKTLQVCRLTSPNVSLKQSQVVEMGDTNDHYINVVQNKAERIVKNNVLNDRNGFVQKPENKTLRQLHI